MLKRLEEEAERNEEAGRKPTTRRQGAGGGVKHPSEPPKPASNGLKRGFLNSSPSQKSQSTSSASAPSPSTSGVPSPSPRVRFGESVSVKEIPSANNGMKVPSQSRDSVPASPQPSSSRSPLPPASTSDHRPLPATTSPRSLLDLDNAKSSADDDSEPYRRPPDPFTGVVVEKATKTTDDARIMQGEADGPNKQPEKKLSKFAMARRGMGHGGT